MTGRLSRLARWLVAHRSASPLALRPSPLARPRRVRVRDAWLTHEHHAGQRLAIAGVVRVFEAGTPREYFTLDDSPHRIGLRGDAAQLRALIGRPVRATGVLSFKPGVGIFLEVEEVKPTAPARRGAWHA